MTEFDENQECIEDDNIVDYADDIVDETNKNPENYQYNIDNYTNAIPVERLVEDFRNNIIKIPSFQRPYVWANKNKKSERHNPSLFIDSLLRGLPTPPITIYKDVDAREHGLLIDGQQRIKTLNWFINEELENKQVPFELKGEGIHKEWYGKTFDSLPVKHKEFLKRAYIPVTYVRQLNEENPDIAKASSLYVLFDRLNSGSYPLDAHEKRSVLNIYNSSAKVFNDFLNQVYNLHEWDDILYLYKNDKSSSKLTRYRELIFRIYAFLLHKEKYNGNLARFLDDFMLNYEISEKESLDLIVATQKALKSTLHLTCKKLFSSKNKFTVSFYELYIVSLIKLYLSKKTISVPFLEKIYAEIEKNVSNHKQNTKRRTPTQFKQELDDSYKLFEEHSDVHSQ